MWRRFFLAVLVVYLVTLLACAAGVKLQFQQPAKEHLRGIKRMVVAPGSGSEEALILSNSIITLLNQTDYFQLYDRNKFSVALEQNHLTYEKVKLADSLHQIGKLLQVDGIIFSELKNLELLPDEQGVEKVEKSVWTGEYERDQTGNIIEEVSPTGEEVKKKKYKIQPVEQHFRFRKAKIGAAFQLIDLKRGASILSRELTENYISDKLVKEESHRIPPDDEIKNRLIVKMVQNFFREIAPRTVSIRRTIEKGIALIDSGAIHARAGRWNRAQEFWDQAQKVHPTDARVYYDLGLACEAQGDYEAAEIYYKKASLLNPKKKLYQKASENIRRMWQKQGPVR